MIVDVAYPGPRMAHGEHLPQEDPHLPHVALEGELVPRQLLRGHGGRAAFNHVGKKVAAFVDSARGSKVADLGTHIRAQDYILGVQVSVQESTFMYVGHPRRNLCRNL